jgi:hypothetical protein
MRFTTEENIWTFEYKTEKVTPDIIGAIKSMRMRWAGHVSHKEEEIDQKFWSENLKGRGDLKDVGVDGRII